jgi:glycosyltransferase involved in cell wall biosynthesis
LDNATGDYIAFVDADDYIDKDMYEIMLGEILQNDADSARCGIVRQADDGSTEDWGTANYDIKVVDNKQLLADVGEGFGILPVSPCNKLFKKECIGDIRFDTRFKFSEDTLFNFMVAKNIRKMVYHDVNRYHYTYNTNSMTSNEINENNFDEHRVMDLIFLLADDDTLPYCIKGDVLKSFRTLRQMILANKYMDRFNHMRNRILSHKKEIFSQPIYSKQTKLRTLLLLISPSGYKFAIKHIRK